MKDLTPRTATTTQLLFKLNERGVGDGNFGINVSETLVHFYNNVDGTHIVFSRQHFDQFVDWYNGKEK